MPLIIKDTIINKLSGPVSMYILTPIQNDLFNKLPIYILFGDMHNSDKGLCEKSSDSMNISSGEFLGLLNILVKPNEYIDFYVEGGDIHNRTPFSELNYTDEYPMHNLWNLYIECYKKKTLATYKYDPTKCEKMSRIRWQSGDIRFFKDEKFKDLLIPCNMHNFLFRFETKDSLTKANFLENLKSFDQYSTETNSCFKKLLSNTISFEDVRGEIFSESGLINKQLQKININQRGKIIDYINTYISHVESSYAENITPEIKQITETLFLIIRNLDNFTVYGDFDFHLDYLKDNWDTFERYRNLSLYKYSILADIYTICRSLKYLNYSDVPIINILYYGNKHTENVVHFLTEIIGKYNIRHSFKYNSSQPDTRCIEIKDEINLNNIVNNVRIGNYDLCIEKPYFLSNIINLGFTLHLRTLNYDIFGIDERSVQSTRQMSWFPKKADYIYNTQRNKEENKIEIIVKLLLSSTEINECEQEIANILDSIKFDNYDKVIIFIFYNFDDINITLPNNELSNDSKPLVLILPIKIWSQKNTNTTGKESLKSFIQFLKIQRKMLGGKSHHRAKSKLRSKSRSKSRGKSRKLSKSRFKFKNK